MATFTTGISTTVKSAQSKKCRMLAKVASHELHYKIALAFCKADQLLGQVCSEADVMAAWNNQSRPGKGKSGSGMVQVEVELD